MRIEPSAVRRCLKSFDFFTLFREHLGWDNCQMQLDIPLDNATFRLTGIAQKRGFVAFLCPSVPDQATRRKIDHQVTKSVHEHFVIYADQSCGQQIWHWVRREPGKPLASRDHRLDLAQAGDRLVQRLDQIAVSLDEEESIGVLDMAGRARSAFDVDRVTKKFYERFKAEHSAFLRLIVGIDLDNDLQWYTSLMLNRLMFIYFIQKKGFLDGDTNYLRNRLTRVQQTLGANRFQSFYRYFLLCLFHEGLGKSPAERSIDPDLRELLGHVPFLNGGFFEVHELEQRYPDIMIPDEAFAKLFDFFDQYSWHLDERPLRADNEINPDVVGYIFEKYVNQKQMGAYYTKEDITEYISKNTVIPYVFDATHSACTSAFTADDAVWRLVCQVPDRYIYASVRKGVVDEQGEVIPLPPDIETGIRDIARRQAWNAPADESYALHHETWRQYVARRRRCLAIRDKLRSGEVRGINDFVTLNLDIWQFARDAITNLTCPKVLRAFWHALKQVAILDPTCGSGAFLFSALQVLETLYSDCLARMEKFLVEASTDFRASEDCAEFTSILAQVALHANERYFILKSILVNNLYGVDIMEEAVEICKLRLFLKLVAQVESVEQIEPLPDIDFNIRAGNTLVGFASISQIEDGQANKLGLWEDEISSIVRDAKEVQRVFDQFRTLQTNRGGSSDFIDKQDLRQNLAALNAKLDRYLAGEYAVDVKQQKNLDLWKATHQPFHWLVEFYGIMQAGGFDVVIGNPPYVSTSTVDYLPASAKESRLTDLYAHMLLRSLAISNSDARFGMILPLSITFSEDFGSVRKRLTSIGRSWFSSYDIRPAALFAGVSQRCTIWIGHRADPATFSSPMYRWRSAMRGQLIENVSYVRYDPTDVSTLGVPKVAGAAYLPLLDAISNPTGPKERQVVASHRRAQHRIRFSQTARNFVSAFKDDPPCLDERTGRCLLSSKIGQVGVAQPEHVYAALAALVGELYFSYWLTRGDGFDVTSWIVADFLKMLDYLSEPYFGLLAGIGQVIHQRRYEALVFKKNAGKYVGNFNYRGHAWITRRADLVLLSGLGADRESALEVLDYVQRVLAINEFAGERSIPDYVKSKFVPAKVDTIRERRVFAETDRVVRERLGVAGTELDCLLYRDAIYRPETEEE